MHVEYEVRVLEVNVDDIKKKLDKIAKFEWNQLQRRYVYDFIPKEKNKWIRLRTNGNKTTLTIKNLVNSKIDGTKELELVVDYFDKTNLILKELGYNPKGYQENRRIQYSLNGVEIDIDSWPMIPTYLEIEGTSVEEVYKIVELLGFKKEDCTTRDVQQIYFDYGYDLDKISELKFSDSDVYKTNKLKGDF